MAARPTSLVPVPEWGVTFTVRALEPDELRLVVALTEAGRPAEAAATVWHLGVVSPACSFAEALRVAAEVTRELRPIGVTPPNEAQARPHHEVDALFID